MSFRERAVGSLFRRKTFIPVVVFIVALSAAIFVIPADKALAVDGSGAIIVLPTSTDIGSTGNTFTFTFTAAETMSSGEIKLQAPSGWSAIQGALGSAGYTTTTSAPLNLPTIWSRRIGQWKMFCKRSKTA